jgi:hypothetical protein
MAAPFNPFKNSFQSAYLDMNDKSTNSPFTESDSFSRSDAFNAVGNPANETGSFPSNIGPTKMNAGVFGSMMSSLASTTNYLDGIFGQPPSSDLSTSVGLSSEASTPIGNASASNATQDATKVENNLRRAYDSVQALYSPMGGRPIAGSEDVRVKADAYGRPFTVVNTSARDSSGQFKERTEFDLAGNPVKTRGNIMEGMGNVGNRPPESQQSQDNRAAYVKSVNDSFAPQIAQQRSAVMQEQEKRNRGEI